MRLAAALLPIFLITGCQTPQKPVIGMVPRGSGQFWQCVRAGAVKAGREFNVDVEWNVPVGDLDATQQITIVDSMIRKHVAGIVLSPADPKLLAPVVERAAKAGIPVVTVNSDVATPNRLTFVTADQRGTGRIAADRIGELMRGEGKAATLAIGKSDPSTMEREAGFTEELKAKYPRIQIVRTAHADQNKAEVIALTHDLLQTHPDLAGLFTGGITSSEGAVYELRSRATTKVRVVAYESSPELVDELRNRFIDVLIVPDLIQMGYQGVRAIATSRKGEAVPGRIACEVNLVDRTNLENPESVKLLFPDLNRYLAPEAN
jgi:ribose transport system substrate-binding protein